MGKKIVQIIMTGVLISLIMVFLSCSGGKEEVKDQHVTYKKIEDVTKESWEKLSKKKIFFAHQSVGGNIIDGIKALMLKNPKIRLNIVKTRDLGGFTNGCFAHSPIGQNVNPQSKIDDFSRVIENSTGTTVDIAFLKLCFVDIHTGTNLDEVFAFYQKKMKNLEDNFPGTTFVHMTVPLTSTPTGFIGFIKDIKGFVKKVIGKINFYDNRVKQDYNDKLRIAYGNRERLFDLAQSESTDLKGVSVTFKDGQRDIQTLVPVYTNDGGHLNELGNQKIAEDLLLFLVNLK